MKINTEKSKTILTISEFEQFCKDNVFAFSAGKGFLINNINDYIEEYPITQSEIDKAKLNNPLNFKYVLWINW